LPRYSHDGRRITVRPARTRPPRAILGDIAHLITQWSELDDRHDSLDGAASRLRRSLRQADLTLDQLRDLSVADPRRRQAQALRDSLQGRLDRVRGDLDDTERAMRETRAALTARHAEARASQEQAPEAEPCQACGLEVAPDHRGWYVCACGAEGTATAGPGPARGILERAG
jgi:hypothetical protein